MTNKLKEYFPMIRTRKEILGYIEVRPELQEVFESWREERQEEFLDFCCGARGIKILYDSFFKEIFNPELYPERLESLLSLLLGKEVKIKQVLPNDSVRLADESTLLITDIVVEFEDGILANIEVQKIGYSFPGQRIACYSADLLLRQYKRVKARKKKFTYRNMKKVYTIVLFEKSTEEFHKCKDCYVHHSEHVFDSGLNLETLQEYVLIALDIFQEVVHNKGIENELDAWLTFISCDEPERMIELMEKYPQFKAMYQNLYDMCLNVEGVMEMFSKELRELDRNTVQYMIEEQEKELERKKKEVEAKKEEVEQKKKEIEQKKKEIEQKTQENEELKMEVEELKEKMKLLTAQLEAVVKTD